MASLLPWSSGRDEELGKRDDDYRPAASRTSPPLWSGSRSNTGSASLRWRRSRLLYILLVIAGFYIIIQYAHSSGPSRLHSTASRTLSKEALHLSTTKGSEGPGSVPLHRGPTGAPTRKGPDSAAGAPSGQDNEEEEHYYSGPIKLYSLKASLEATVRTSGHRDINRNVLFAASNLRSAANLLPLACDMASSGDTFVHFILVGRAAIPLHDLLKINNIDLKTCDIWLHDGRPDYSEYSTDVRAEASVVGAMNHAYRYMHPQAVITDDPIVEDAFFSRGVKAKMGELHRAVIEIPAGKYTDFRWMTKLTADAVRRWHDPRVEIVVQSPPNAGGGLARLLKSLSEAEYSGFRVPKLTIELPSKKDSVLDTYLSHFVWPPVRTLTQPNADLLKVQKRIPSTKIDSQESSVRFVESYFPSHMYNDNVLVLSSNVELSPSFFHYLMYNLLQTWHNPVDPDQREHLAGIALASPHALLDGTSELKRPPMSALRGSVREENGNPGAEDGALPSFLWQAPTADALLIFGERWIEFHDYLRRRLDSLSEHPDAPKPPKIVSTQQPAWLEFLVELGRSRAWTYLYPPSSPAGAWATVHKELVQTPEEYRHVKPKASQNTNTEPIKSESSEPFLIVDENSKPSLQSDEKTLTIKSQPLHDLLPFDGALPDTVDLPLLSLDGTVLKNLDEAIEASNKFALDFRSTMGGCKPSQAKEVKKRVSGKAGDLFCLTYSDDAEDFEFSDVDDSLLFLKSDQSADIEPSPAPEKRASPPRAVEELKGRDKEEVRKEQDLRADEKNQQVEKAAERIEKVNPVDEQAALSILKKPTVYMEEPKRAKKDAPIEIEVEVGGGEELDVTGKMAHEVTEANA